MKSKTPSGSLRIIGGKWRSRKVAFPAVNGLRPTADRVRETLFNWLRNDCAQQDCLDLYAGSGACGLEALSRGARHVTFVERNPLTADAIRASLHQLGAPEMPVICADAASWLSRAAKADKRRFGIVFIDPPFADKLELASCAALENSGLLRDQALIYLESAGELLEERLPSGWRPLRQKRAGSVFFTLIERNRSDDGEPASD